MMIDDGWCTRMMYYDVLWWMIMDDGWLIMIDDGKGWWKMMDDAGWCWMMGQICWCPDHVFSLSGSGFFPSPGSFFLGLGVPFFPISGFRFFLTRNPVISVLGGPKKGASFRPALIKVITCWPRFVSLVSDPRFCQKMSFLFVPETCGGGRHGDNTGKRPPPPPETIEARIVLAGYGRNL